MISNFPFRLVPHLSPTHECTVVPKEVCQLRFNTPKQVTKPLISKWCLDMSTVIEVRSEANTNSKRKMNQNELRKPMKPNLEYDEDYEQNYDEESVNNYDYSTSANIYEYQQESKLQQSTIEIADSYELPPKEKEHSNMDEIRQAEKKYIVPSDSDKKSKQETKSIDENYGAPGNDETTVVVPIRKEYIATDSSSGDEVSDHYDSPQDEYDGNIAVNIKYEAPHSHGIKTVEKNSEPVLIESQESYGSPEEEQNEDGGNTAPDTGYEAPSLPDSLYNAPEETDDFESLGNYGTRANSMEEDSQVNQRARKPETIYTIDSGFGEQPKYSYTRPDDLAGYQLQNGKSPGLNRHLIPPRPENGNFAEHNNNKIRSVDPFYRI